MYAPLQIYRLQEQALSAILSGGYNAPPAIMKKRTPGLTKQYDTRELLVREYTILSAVYFLMYAAVGMTVMIPLVLQSRGVSLSRIGYLSAMFAASGALTQFGVGRLSDKLQLRRPFVILPAIVLTGAYLLMIPARSFTMFAILHLVAGASFHTTGTAVAAAIADWSSPSGKTASAFGNARLWGSMGFVVSLAVLSRWLGSDRTILGATAIFFLLMGMVMLGATEPKHHAHASAELSKSVRTLLGDRRLIWFLSAFLLFKMAESGAMAYITLRLAGLGGSRQLIGWALVFNAVFEIPLMRWAGPLSERIGRAPVILTAFLVLPLRMLAYGVMPTAAWVFPIQLFHGFTYSFMTVGSIAYVQDRSSKGLRATAQGMLAATMGLGMCAGPLLAGVLSGAIGIGPLFFALSTVAALGGVIFWLFVREPLNDPVQVQ